MNQRRPIFSQLLLVTGSSLLAACAGASGPAIVLPAPAAPAAPAVTTAAGVSDGASEQSAVDRLAAQRARFTELLQQVDNPAACQEAATLGAALVAEGEAAARLPLARVYYYLADFHLRQAGTLQQMRASFMAGADLARQVLLHDAGPAYRECRTAKPLTDCLAAISTPGLEALYWYGVTLDGLASLGDLGEQALGARRRVAIWTHLAAVASPPHLGMAQLRRGVLAASGPSQDPVAARRWFAQAARAAPTSPWIPLLTAWHLDTRDYDVEAFTRHLEQVLRLVEQSTSPSAELRLVAHQARWLLSQRDVLFGPRRPGPAQGRLISYLASEDRHEQ